VHHRAVHVGELVILGSASSLSFQHADGTPYGHTIDPHAVDVQTKVFSALRNLGFLERETRAVMAQLRQDEGSRALDAQALLRVALQRLAPPARC
jgi:Holliday junction resolvasome RuvABC DNA-binding subunit